jgi:hypothetical protein
MGKVVKLTEEQIIKLIEEHGKQRFFVPETEKEAEDRGAGTWQIISKRKKRKLKKKEN